MKFSKNESPNKVVVSLFGLSSPRGPIGFYRRKSFIPRKAILDEKSDRDLQSDFFGKKSKMAYFYVLETLVSDIFECRNVKFDVGM